MNHMTEKRRIKLYCILFVLLETARLLFYGDFDFSRLSEEGALPDAGTCLHILIIIAFAVTQAISFFCFRKNRVAGILTVFSLIVCSPEIINYSVSPLKLFSFLLFFIYLSLAAVNRKYINTVITAAFLTISVMLVPSNIFSVALMIIAVYWLADSDRIRLRTFAVFAFCAVLAFIANRLLLKLGLPYWIMSAGDLSFRFNISFGILNIIRYLLLIFIAAVLICSLFAAAKEFENRKKQIQPTHRSADGKSRLKEKNTDQKLLPFKRKRDVLLVISAGFFVSVFGELFTSCGSTAVMLILVCLLMLSEDSESQVGKALSKADTFFKNHFIIWMAALYFIALMHNCFGIENKFYSTVTHFFFG